MSCREYNLSDCLALTALKPLESEMYRLQRTFHTVAENNLVPAVYACHYSVFSALEVFFYENALHKFDFDI